MWAGFSPLWGIILAYILQSTIPSIRPPGACTANGSDCGMPSGHVITAYSTITFLFFMWGRDLKLLGVQACLAYIMTPLGFLSFLVIGTFVMIQILMPVGRIYIKYHTEAQVGFGVLTGFLVGATWFVVVLYVVGKYVGPWMEKKLSCLGVNDDWTHTGEQSSILSKGEDSAV